MKITISLPTKIAKKAKEFASFTGRSFSGLIKFCLQKELSHKVILRKKGPAHKDSNQWANSMDRDLDPPETPNRAQGVDI